MFTQPNFFFIGGMRCGSTSLNLMLEQHPEIYMSPVKEPHYYLAEAFRNLKEPSPENRDFLKKFEKNGKYRTDATYQSLFKEVGGAKIVGESSHYIYYSKTAGAIYKHCPEARILVCLRNPVDRLFSEYLLFLRERLETGCFADYVARCAAGYLNGNIPDKINVPKLNKGLQAELLVPWINQFGRDQIKLVLFDDLNESPAETMMDIFSWLEIDESFVVQKIHAQKGGALKAKWMNDVMNSKHKLLNDVKSLMPKSLKIRLRSSIYSKILERPEIEAETRAFLTQFYRDDVEKLSDIVDKDLSAWCQTK
jgi:hypothetical protein